jgi:Na+/melibiose symporter-like transporter
MSKADTSRGTRWQLAYASGSLGTQVVFGVAPAFLPLMLERQFGSAPLAVGAILALAPAAGLLTLPLANRASRPGRRLPFLVAATPLTALALGGLALAGSAGAAAAAVAATFVALNLFLGPYRASLGEEVEPAAWLRVSALQTAFKGLGSLLVLAGGGLLYQLSALAPFVAAAIVFLASAGVACLAMGWGRRPAAPAAEPPAGNALAAARGLEGLLLAQVLWWIAFDAVFTFTIPFIVHDVAGVADAGSPAGLAAAATAVPLLTTFAVVSMVAAAPLARLAERFGTERVLAGGLAASAAGTAMAVVADTVSAGYVFAVLGGIGFASIQALAYPLLLTRRRHGTEGDLAALFEVGGNLAQLIGLISMGGIITLAGSYRGVFAVATLALALATATVVWAARPAAEPIRP